MESNSGYHEKMDALDLVINALKDHEKRLDEISHSLEKLLEKSRIGEVREVRIGEREAYPPRRSPLVIYRNWSDFKEKCREARLVAFDIEKNFFNVYTLINGKVFKYMEELPEKRLKIVDEESSLSIDKSSLSKIELLRFLIEGRLKCGLTLHVKSSITRLTEREYLIELRYDFKVDEVKDFFFRELSLPKDKVIEGKIAY